jgi:hypothetical protein
MRAKQHRFSFSKKTRKTTLLLKLQHTRAMTMDGDSVRRLGASLALLDH